MSERRRTLLVALVVSAVCSIGVSLVSVQLRDAQRANVENDKRARILAAAGRTPSDGDVERAFAGVSARTVRLDSGELVDPARADESEISLTYDEDIAQIRTRENYATVYFFGEPENFSALVLPVRGYGLWSTLYGYLALDSSLTQVLGLEFYEHKETAGLGGEVENPKWKALWRGKEVYDDRGELALEVLKGRVPEESSRAGHQVDGLAGATLTSRGVTNLLAFWLGEKGFGPLLRNLAPARSSGAPGLSPEPVAVGQNIRLVERAVAGRQAADTAGIATEEPGERR